MVQTLADLLTAAALGRFPEPDGGVTVLPQPSRRDAGVIAFTAHSGVLVLGRGVAGRWEAAIEVDEDARGRGLGPSLATAARHLVPDGRPVWAQQAPGNARSVRVFQAAGYRAAGAEILLHALPAPTTHDHTEKARP